MAPKSRLFCEYLVFNLDATYVLFILTVGYFSSQYDRYVYSVSQISFVNYNSYEYGLIAGPIFSIVYTATAIMIGSLFQKCRVLGMSLVMGFWSVIIALVAVTTRFWQVALLRAALAVGEAGYTPLASSLLGDYFPLRIRGTAMGVFVIGLYAGYGSSLAGGKAINNELGWRWSYATAGILPAALCGLMFLTIHEPDWSKRKVERDDQVESSETGNVNTQSVVTFSYWCEHKSLIAISVAAGVRNLAGLCIANFSAAFFQPMFNSMPEEFQKHECQYSYNSNYSKEQVCDAYYPYCVDGQCVDLSSSPWHNVGMPTERFEIFMLLVPVIFGSLGTIAGGVISDKYAKVHGPLSRLLFLGASNLIASPFAAGALLLPYSYCFMSLSVAYLFGEMWGGVTLALIIDIVPREISATSLAVMLAIKALIGGCGPLLVPVLRSAFQSDQMYKFNADNIAGSANAVSGYEVQFVVTQPSSDSLEYALLLLYVGCLALSSVFFIIAYCILKGELNRTEKSEFLYSLEEDASTRHPLLEERQAHT